MKCPCEDDNGVVCNKPMSKEEQEQDGMCIRCAELLWANFAQPLASNKPTKPIIFKEGDETQRVDCSSPQ